MSAASEFAAKHARVAAWLAEHGADAVLLHAPANVAWLASGGEVRRRHGAAPAFVVGTQRVFLLCASDDADRLRQEEVRGLALDLVPSLAAPSDPLVERARALLPDARTWRTDVAGTALERASGLDALRRTLLPAEVERLSRLGRDAAAAIEEVAAECYRGIFERDAAGRLAAECARRSIDAQELVCGADDRLETYIRPLPKATSAERALVLAIVGSRGGLHVAVARTVCLSRPSDAFVERFTANLEIAARLLHETRAGDTLGGAVARALPQPPVHLGGLGGTIGYAYPETDARASSTWQLTPPQPLVWSVAGAGARVEDTYVLQAAGLERVTATESWPQRTVRVGAATMELPDLLQL